MTKRNDSLGVSISRLKDTVNNMKMHHVMSNHAFAINIITKLKDIIDVMEIPELIGGSNGKANS
jgi:cell division FtsZ-interacting protein ZapD|tara:strand:- start:520 stop:711 length:192 start_codon:yes stop_codon:yes gene_type:complete